MLEINGIPPRLGNQVCAELFCQQFWYRDKLEQDVDAMFLKVNGRWHQLYFDAGIMFWRILHETPMACEYQPGDPIVYRLVDIGDKFDIKQCVIADYITEPLVTGVRVSLVFEDKGSLIVTYSEDKTALCFIETRWGES